MQSLFSLPKIRTCVNLRFATQQYRVLMQKTPPDRMPRTYSPKEDKLVISHLKGWCSGFYPGTFWYSMNTQMIRSSNRKPNDAWRSWKKKNILPDRILHEIGPHVKHGADSYLKRAVL
ncbi:MAG: hypothetical protein ICV65_06105 [Flavisolibacter sp.]|nr:hypothetical protein [Flavisolibacter sp.]